MLKIYFEVENFNIQNKNLKNNFCFDAKEVKLVDKRSYNSVEKSININVRHTLIQRTLCEKLIKQYGENNVSLENDINGGRIDVSC
jgi:hypothetical protein